MNQSAGASNALPTFTNTQIVHQLTDAYWEWEGLNRLYLQPDDGRTVTVNLSALNNRGETLAREALDMWENVTPLRFVETASNADITFTDTGFGAITNFSYFGDEMLSATINIADGWVRTYGEGFDTYSMQTYVHEIGHALGLGHAGFYDGTARFDRDAHYANDSWQMTMMSYFSQADNPYIEGAELYAVTPMLADLLAIEELYGFSHTNRGATIYGANSNVGGYMEELFEKVFDPGWRLPEFAFTVRDTGGKDLMDFQYELRDQKIDLTPGGISDVGGQIGNMVIAMDTLIERAITGEGDDILIGNGVRNVLIANEGNDTLSGGMRADVLDGGSGNDEISGDAGRDKLKGRGGNDTLNGGGGDDKLSGQGGNDVMTGGKGADTFEFNLGNDRITDFSDDEDILALSSRLWTGTLTADQIVEQFTVDEQGTDNSVFFRFETNETLRVEGVSDSALLVDDIIIL